MQESKYVVVGYDGSAEAAQAVRWAAHQAVLRKCSLHVVHCSLWPMLTQNLAPVPGVADSGLERAAELTLDDGVAHAKSMAPELDVRASLVYGWPAVHLPKMSAGQEMLVVGSRGLGGFLGLLVGSVSLEMAATADCPVAVIRAGNHPDGPVVVAVDASGSAAALADACEMASLTGSDLRVVHVQHGRKGSRRAPADEQQAAEVLDAALSWARGNVHGVSVDGELLSDTSAARAIVAASEDAGLTVVGTRGHGLIKGSIGSTAHAVLHHAKGPVLVSRRGGDDPGENS
ncbi:universal stress protein [Specibacter sp. RAF43]|uniref:universal stress protein n=1 Tax=Specibacter sp. RAF43 TaxID=3233057 RepID=UPI003F9E23AA